MDKTLMTAIIRLWFPLLFVVAFLLTFQGATTHLEPRNLQVAVVGTGRVTGLLVSALNASSRGAFAVQALPTLAQARSDVAQRDLVAAYVPTTRVPTLYVATLASPTLASTAEAFFQAVAAARDARLKVIDLAPPLPGDSTGISSFFLMVVWTIGGMITVLFAIGGVPSLPLRSKLAIVAGSTAVVSLLSNIIAGPIYGVVAGHFAALFGIGWFMSVTSGLVTLGVQGFLGGNTPGVTLPLFVFFGFTASGGPFPAQMLPGIFQFFNRMLPTAFAERALRDVAFFGGSGVAKELLSLLAWAVAGAVLIAVSQLPRRPRTVGVPAQGGTAPESAQAAGAEDGAA